MMVSAREETNTHCYLSVGDVCQIEQDRALTMNACKVRVYVQVD